MIVLNTSSKATLHDLTIVNEPVQQDNNKL